MPKLPQEYRFVDLSDYSRPIARALVQSLFKTPVSSIHLTVAFFVAGLLGIYFVYQKSFLLAALFLMIKNILDAADGEMARVRKHPTYTGRYLDSIFDFFVNLGLFYVLYVLTGASIWLFVASFLGLEFQGTIFNYYYLVQRKLRRGDATSKINEFERPVAFDYENPHFVRVLHLGYLACYGLFDGIMLRLDQSALGERPLPNWFMTLVSSIGLGFQILLIVLFLLIGRVEYILPFFLFYTLWGVVIILIRKMVVHNVEPEEEDRL